jgi:hypothetical protein
MIITWNIREWMQQILPPRLKDKPKAEAWFYIHLKPVQTLFEQLIDYRTETNKKLRYNSQTIVLESLLNDKFDQDQRSIYIVTESDILPENYLFQDGSPEPPLYLFTDADDTDEVWIYTDEEYEQNYDFVVYLRDDLVYDAAQLVSTVNYYKLAGKLFIINTY